MREGTKKRRHFRQVESSPFLGTPPHNTYIHTYNPLPFLPLLPSPRSSPSSSPPYAAYIYYPLRASSHRSHTHFQHQYKRSAATRSQRPVLQQFCNSVTLTQTSKTQFLSASNFSLSFHPLRIFYCVQSGTTTTTIDHISSHPIPSAIVSTSASTPFASLRFKNTAPFCDPDPSHTHT